MVEQHQRVDLPTELIYSILLRLPVKSLTRFKSLSNLISHPSFQQDHYLHREPLPNPLLLLLTETNRRTRTHTLRFSTPLTNFSKTIPIKRIPIKRIHYHDPTLFVLIGSCLGLVCIASASDRTILVCNPSTQEIASLPQPPQQGFIQCVGFGYASSQFKVVRFFNLERYGSGENCCETFTLGSSDGWRRTVAPPYNPKWGGTFLNGAIHLMPEEAYGEGYEDHCIAAFDVDAEKYQTVPLPKIGEALSYTHETHLVVLRGSLCLAFYFETRKLLELWFLKDYDDGKWAKEYDIDFSSVDGVFLPYPVSFMGDGRILLSVYCGGGQYEHCWYNTQERCFFPKERHENCSIRLFTETFVPLRTEIRGRQRLLLPYP